MKIVHKVNRGEKTRVVTLRLPDALMKEIDQIVKKEGLSRQALVAAILRGALADKALKIEV